MRILLSTLGSRGDVEPMAGLAVALQTRGVEAVVNAPPDPEFVDLLDRAGVPLAPAFMGMRDFIAMARQSPMPLPRRAAEVMAAQVEAVGAAAEGCDAIVATGLLPSAAAAHCVAEMRGLPYVYATFCPLFLPSEAHAPFPYPDHPHPEGLDNRALWAHDIDTMNAIFGGAVNEVRSALGLPAIDNVRDHVFTDRPLLASDPALWPWAPTELCDADQTGAWILPDSRSLSGALEAFLRAGEPPVYFGFGSLPTHDPLEAARIAVAAARRQGRRVVLLRGWAGLDRVDDGADCFVTGEVNQQALFGRVAAVVHHGGAGTTTAAARAGAPQVVVPQIVDQPFWAARVAELGLGAAHEGAVPTADSLAKALEIALAPETVERAKAFSGRVRSDGAESAAARILARLGRRGVG